MHKIVNTMICIIETILDGANIDPLPTFIHGDLSSFLFIYLRQNISVRKYLDKSKF